jgi:hypothetical protein
MTCMSGRARRKSMLAVCSSMETSWRVVSEEEQCSRARATTVEGTRSRMVCNRRGRESACVL